MDMPVIRVSESTWARMKRHAQPLEDTADDIVRRALDALEGKPSESKKAVKAARSARATTGEVLPQKELRNPLLLTLDELGGSGSLSQVRDRLYPRINARLREADHRIVSTGEPRWWNAACWERWELAKEGYLRADSRRGQWELSRKGREEVGKLKSA